MVEYTQIRLDIADGIATVTLHRPEKMNAFTGAMMHEMIDAVDRTGADDSVRAVIVTGSGKSAFCAGAGLTPDDGQSAFASDDAVADLSDPRVRDSGGLLALRTYQSKKPVIGAINGAAVGVTMQLPMDIRLASTKARFGLVFAPAWNRAGSGIELVSAAHRGSATGAGMVHDGAGVRCGRSPSRWPCAFAA